MSWPVLTFVVLLPLLLVPYFDHRAARVDWQQKGLIGLMASFAFCVNMSMA